VRQGRPLLPDIPQTEHPLLAAVPGVLVTSEGNGTINGRPVDVDSSRADVFRNLASFFNGVV
jgi:hypothetical protein